MLCHQSQERGRDILTSSLSLPRGWTAWLPPWGSRKSGDKKRCSQVEQETASLGQADSCPRDTGQRDCSEPPPPANLCSAPGGGPRRPDSPRVGTASQMEACLQAAVTPGNTALPPPRGGQLFPTKHSGTEYFNTHRRSKKHSNDQNRNNPTEQKRQVSFFQQQRIGSNLNVQQRDVVTWHRVARGRQSTTQQ